MIKGSFFVVWDTTCYGGGVQTTRGVSDSSFFIHIPHSFFNAFFSQKCTKNASNLRLCWLVFRKFFASNIVVHFRALSDSILVAFSNPPMWVSIYYLQYQMAFGLSMLHTYFGFIFVSNLVSKSLLKRFLKGIQIDIKIWCLFFLRLLPTCAQLAPQHDPNIFSPSFVLVLGVFYF